MCGLAGLPGEAGSGISVIASGASCALIFVFIFRLLLTGWK
jgi:hypothetical protein